MFSYNPLWKMLIDNNINKSQLAEKSNLSKSTLAKMGKNQYVDMSSLDKICNTFNCGIEDIIKHIKD